MNRAIYHFLRHLPPAKEMHGVMYGGGDIPLDTTSHDVLARLTELTTMLPHDAQWASSPVPRALKTCDMIKERHHNKSTIMIIEQFAEQNFGNFVGKTHDELREDPDFKAYRQDFANVGPPQGESFTVFQNRTALGLRELTKHFNQGHVVIGAHGGIIRALMCIITATPIQELMKSVTVSPLSKLTIIYENNMFKIADFNQGVLSSPLTHPAQLK